MNWPRVLLEDWLREYYFEVEIDLGCSGVEDYSFADLRRLLDLGGDALDEVVFHDSQTLGGPGLREAIADAWAHGDAGKVMATHGSSEAMFLLLNALLGAGDEIVVSDPCYPQFRLIAETIGCRVKGWPLRFEQRFEPDLEGLLALITPATKMVIINSPHNPTGAALRLDERGDLIKACADVGAYLVWDDAFGQLVYDRSPLPSPVGSYERLLVLGTLSKAYGLPGMRVGWCLGEPEVLENVSRLRDYITLSLSPLIEKIATRVVEKSDLLLQPRLEQCRNNLELLGRWSAERPDQISWIRPKGGASAFPRFHALDDVADFCQRLAQEESVLLVPGRCFGYPQHARLGFGCATATFAVGLERLGRRLDSLR